MNGVSRLFFISPLVEVACEDAVGQKADVDAFAQFSISDDDGRGVYGRDGGLIPLKPRLSVRQPVPRRFQRTAAGLTPVRAE